MQTFSLLGGQIAGVRWGQGRKVLAFHGYLDNAMSFQPLASELTDVEIWAIDLPGHGLSSMLPQTDGMFLLHWLPTLGRILDELDWPEYEILGHSLGAIVSQLLAAVDTRISALYSLDALGPLASNSEQNVSRLTRLYRSRNKSIPIRYYDNHQSIIDSRLKGPFPLSPQAAEVMAKRAVGLGEKGWFHRYDRRLRHESVWRMDEQEVLAVLRQIQCPLHLAVFGANQWDGYRGVFEQRKAVLRQLEESAFAGSHHLHMEQPQLVAGWLTKALLL